MLSAASWPNLLPKYSQKWRKAFSALLCFSLNKEILSSCDGVKREIMAIWGDSEVKELLLRADDKEKWRFSGTVNMSEKVDVTQTLTLSSSRIRGSESRIPALCE